MNILIADEQRIIQEGIKSIISDETKHHILEAVSTVDDLFLSLAGSAPNLLILDMGIPNMEGGKTIREMLKRYPRLKILALTYTRITKELKDLLEAGVLGLLLHNSKMEDLINAIQFLEEGKQFLGSNIIKAMASTHYEPPNGSILTDREEEILCLICQEFTNREIAPKLNISVRTVDAHRRNILQKTNSQNTAGIVKFAIKNSLFSLQKK